jgi:hypothetical protein
MTDQSEQFARLRESGSNINKMLLLVAVAGFAIYFFFIRLPGHAELSNMVPGMNPGGSRLECWLTIDFNDRPNVRDLSDVKVVFSSQALAKQQSFNWDWIAKNDYQGGRGSHRELAV